MPPTRPPARAAGSGDVGEGASANTDGLLQDGGGPSPAPADSARTPAFEVVFARRTSRVKAVALHPSRPHCLIACYSGLVACFDMDRLLNPTGHAGVAGAPVVVQAHEADATSDHDDGHDDHDGAHPDDVALLWRGFSGGLAADCEVPVRGVAWCPIDPELFAVGNDAMQVHLGRSPGPGERAARTEHTFVDAAGDYIRSVAFHAARPLLFVASDDMLVHVFDWQRRHRVAVARGHEHYVLRAVPHRTLPIFASVGLDKTARLWRVPAEAVAAEPRTMDDDAGDANAKTPGWLSGCCRWWSGPAVGEDAPSVEALAVGRRHEEGINGVEFDTASDHRLFTGSDDRTVMMWEFDATYARLSPLRVIHQGDHFMCFVAPLPVHAAGSGDPPLVLCGGEDHRVVFVAASEPPVVVRGCRGDGRFWAAVVTPDASVAIVGHDSGFVGLRLPPSASVSGFAPLPLPLPE